MPLIIKDDKNNKATYNPTQIANTSVTQNTGKTVVAAPTTTSTTATPKVVTRPEPTENKATYNPTQIANTSITQNTGKTVVAAPTTTSTTATPKVKTRPEPTENKATYNPTQIANTSVTQNTGKTVVAAPTTTSTTATPKVVTRPEPTENKATYNPTQVTNTSVTQNTGKTVGTAPTTPTIPTTPTTAPTTSITPTTATKAVEVPMQPPASVDYSYTPQITPPSVSPSKPMETSNLDERLAQIEEEKQKAIAELESKYNGMAADADRYYQSQMDATRAFSKTQSELQQANSDFAIEKLEQQKGQAGEEYRREQAGAYTDWQRQSNQYGAAAEQMAAAGLNNTGYSESAQVSMYNAYQNRVATAREAYNVAVLNYDNAMKDARLQNSSVLASIAYEALQKELSLSLQSFNYKNDLMRELVNVKADREDAYHGQYMDVLNQINRENEFNESVRQFNASYDQRERQFADNLAEQARQYNLNYDQKERQYQQNLNEEIRQANLNFLMKEAQMQEEIRRFDVEMERLRNNDSAEAALKLAQLAQQKQLAQEQLAEEQRQFDLSLEKQWQYDLSGEENTVPTGILRSEPVENETKSSVSQSKQEPTHTGTAGLLPGLVSPGNPNFYKLASASPTMTGDSEGLSGARQLLPAANAMASYSGGALGLLQSNKKASDSNVVSSYITNSQYTGAINADANEYGVFENGYQPMGINGHGAVAKTGDTVMVETVLLNGTKATIEQNIWSSEDGGLWYWNGVRNRYEQIKQ